MAHYPSLRVPLHIAVADESAPADSNRLHLLQRMSSLTGGRGFRFPSNKTDKIRKVTRPERLGKRLTKD